MANNINFKVGFSVDKAGLDQSIKQLKEIQKISANDMFKIKGGDFNKVNTELKNAKEAAKAVEKAVQEAFNPRLNTVDFQKLNSILKTSYGNVSNLNTQLSGAGAAGVNAFNNIQNSLTSLNQKMKTSDSLLDKIGKTLMNTIRWNLSSSVVNQFTASLQEAYGYVKHLDTSLNDIRIVTGKSADEMERFARTANTAAQALGKSTNDYTEAALIYAQQGLGDEEIAARTEVTLKAANVTGQSAEAVSEQLTAVWNGYQITAENAEKSVDKLAAIASTTASNLEELSTGMSKVASAANAMGVSEDQLAAMLSTIISVTKNAPESVGTALRTIFARISDIEAGIDEDGVTLGNYSGKMQELGFSVLDANNKLRDMGDVVEEIGSKWGTLTREQQINLAQTMAGQRQYSQLIALFDNWDQYTSAINTAADAEGTLQRQQDIYMESTAAHLEQMSAALENVYDSFLGTDSINAFADAITNMANTLAGFIDSLGGGKAVLLNFGAIATRVFSDQIAGSLTKSIKQMQDMKNLANQSKAMFEFFKGDENAFAASNGLEENQQRLMAVKEQIQKASSAFSEEELNNIQNQIDKIQELINKNNEYAEATERINQLNNRSANTEARKIKYGEDYDQDYVKSIDVANEQLKNIQDQLKTTEAVAKDSFKNLSKNSEEFANSLKEMDINSIPEGLIDQFKTLSEEIKILKEAGEDLVSNELISFEDSQYEQIKKINQEFKNGKIQQDQYQAELAKIAQAVVEKTTTVTSEIQKEIQANEALKQKAAEMAAAQSELYDAQTRLANQTKQQVDLQNLNESITTVISSIGQLGAAVTSISSLFQIWGDDTSSVGEKLAQTFTNLLFVVPQVVTGISDLISAVKILSTNSIVLNFASKVLTATEYENAVAAEADGAAHLTFAGALNVVTAAAGKALIALKALIVAHPIIAGVTAAVIALGVAIAAISWYNDESKRELERLREETEQATEAAKKLNDEYSQFKDLKTGYEDAVESLNDLRKGTEEYTEALEQANEKARELLDLYPQLAEGVHINSDGLLVFDQNTLDNIESGKQQASMGASISATVAQNKELAYEKKTLTAGSLSAEQTRELVAAIQATGKGFTEEGLKEAINSGLSTFTRDVYNAQTGMWEKQKLSVDEISRKVGDLDELKLISGKMDSIDSQIGINGELLANDLKNLVPDFESMNQGTQKAIETAIIEGLVGDNFQSAIDEASKKYAEYSDAGLKAAFEEMGGVLSEEDKGKDQDEQNQIMIDYLANIEAYSKILEDISTKIPELRENAIENTKGLNTTSHIEGLNEDFVDFISGDTSIDVTIPPSYKEAVKKALDDLYKDPSFYTANEEFLNSMGIKSAEEAKEVIAAYRQAIDDIDYSSLATQFAQNLDAAVSGLDLKNFSSDNLLDQIYQQVGGDADAFNATIEQLNNLDFNNENTIEKVGQLTEAFSQGSLTIDEYISNLNRVATEDFLNNLNFEDFANSIGFSKSDAEYLSSLMQQVFDDASVGANGLNKAIAESPELLQDVTRQIARLQKGYKNLYDNTDKWISALESGGREGIEAMDNIREAMADILDLDMSEIDSSFVTDNLDLIKQAAQGSEEAVAQLQAALYEADAKEISIQMSVNDAEIYDKLISWGNELAAFEANNDIEIGAIVDDSGLIDGLNSMIESAGLTADQVNELLGDMGYEPVYETADIPQETTSSAVDTTQTITTKTEKVGYNGEDTYTVYETKTTHTPVESTNEGSMEVTAVKGNGQAPKVTGIRKKASGGGGNKTSAYKPSAPTSSGSGGKGSGGKGGGGGGSGTAKESKQKDLLEEEADRYHDINIELQNINRGLDRLADVQKKLTGRDLINNLNKQLEILEKQVDAYERKAEIAKVELAENKIALSQMGVTFDENGQISNYIEAYQAALKKYNDAVTAYNLMSAEEQEATGEAAIELAKKEFDKFKEKLDRYDELINEVIPDLEDNIQDAINKQIELNIEKFKMEIEVRLDMADAERSWNEFKKKVIDSIKDDDFLGIIKSQYADLLTYFNTAETGKGPIQALTEQLNGTLDQLKSMDGTLGDWASSYGDDRASALEDLQEYLDKLMNQMMDVENLVKDIEDTYLDMIDSIKDAFDEQLDNYKLIDDIIEHNKNVIELLYGEDAYDQMAQYYDKQEQKNLQQLDFLRQEANFWKEKMDAEEQGSEAWKQYKKNWEDALGNLNDQVENSIKTLIDKYTNLIDGIFDKLNDKVSSGLGLDYLSDEWDLINKNADEYLDTINRAYETQKLQDKFNEALANNSGLKAQQQIKDLMDQQLGDLAQREKLTQYDVERAEKLLDIELKKIALQDAQQNKSKMRLRRDAQGNYSYQFVSDEQQIKDAQKELADAQNELYNFDKDRYKDNLNKIYDTYNEFQEKLKELYADTTLSEEERERKRVLLIQQYNELITGLTEQNAQIRLNLEDSAFTELAKMYNTNVEEFKAMTEEQRNALLEGLLPYWNSGIQEMVNTFAGEGGFIPTCSDSFDQLDEATKNYIDSLGEIESAADVNFGALAEGYDKNIELAQELIVKNDELINQYERELNAVQDVLSAVRDLSSEYAAVKQNAIEASEAAMKYAQEEAKRKAEAAEEERKKLEAATQPSGSTTNNNSSSSNSSNSQSSSSSSSTSSSNSKAVTLDSIKKGDKLRYIGGWYYWDSNGTSPRGNRGPGKEVTVERVYPEGKKYKVAVTSTDSAYGWLNVEQLERLKSGGYTGEWGESGKLGILDQKELILNESDTKNLLDAVTVLRGLSDVLGARTLANLSATLDKIRVTPVPDTKEETEVLEQQVTITATFPNVKNSNEVEEAINNLINTAAQRKNRRGR